jgi:hypothetical protein
MKIIKKVRNVKSQIPLPIKVNNKTELALKNPPNLKPKNKFAK